MTWKVALQLLGIALGLLYLWLEYRANIWLWVVGVVMPLVHGVLYYRSGLYADCAMNGYYVVAGIYGWWMWQRGTAHSELTTQPICHTPRHLVGVLVGSYAMLHIGIYVVLLLLTNSTVPFWDSMTTALSIVALWMLSRKYVEQWLVWLVVDALTVGLYLYKGIPLTASLYLLYTVLAFVGYRRWSKQCLHNTDKR
jgi:nicotinamide mononucleotide transporter